MQDKAKIDLGVSEVAGLFNLYMNDTMAVCTLKYFLSRVEDDEIRSVLQLALNMAKGHIPIVIDTFNQEGLPIPKGFKEDDVDINAPRLFTDPFYLFYLLKMAQIGLNSYALIFNHIGSPDIRDFYSKCITESVELYNKIIDVLQSQGLYIKPPRVEFSKTIDFIDNQNFFSSGWLDRKRPLLAREITAIFATIRYNIVAGALLTGFSQVAKSKKLSEFLSRGRDLADKKIEKLTDILINEKIPIPSTSDSFVTDSTVAPFSDKLMLFHIMLLASSKIGQDGYAFANVLRHDLHAYFSGSIAEIGKYGEDALDIMIENRWMEQPPQAIDHRELVKVAP